MPLSAGTKFGPYKILAPIGAGGMGEVYKAHEPRLNRDVAIKVSAAQFSERCEREAKAIAALNDEPSTYICRPGHRFSGNVKTAACGSVGGSRSKTCSLENQP